jgi:hypothetical protein
VCNPLVAEGEPGSVFCHVVGCLDFHILKDTPDKISVNSLIRVYDSYTAVGDTNGVSFVCESCCHQIMPIAEEQEAVAAPAMMRPQM